MAELTSSTREAARRLGVSDTSMHKADRTGRITREPYGHWDHPVLNAVKPFNLTSIKHSPCPSSER
jgi:hypothetical protein